MADFAIVDSPLSQSIAVEGHRFEIQIYRREHTLWSLEVVHAGATSFFWDALFPTDEDALGAALAAFENSPIGDFI